MPSSRPSPDRSRSGVTLSAMGLWTSRQDGLDYLTDLDATIAALTAGRTNLIGYLQNLHDNVLPPLLDLQWPAQPAPPSGIIFRFDAGGQGDGATWNAGAGFIGGTVRNVGQVFPAAADAAPIGVLQTVLVGSAGWSRPLAAQMVVVRVHVLDAASSASGQNVVNVSVDGDLYAQGVDGRALTGRSGAEYVLPDIVVNHSAATLDVAWPATVGASQITAIEILDGTGRSASTPITTGPSVIAIPADGSTWRRSDYANTTVSGAPVDQVLVAGPNIDVNYADGVGPVAGVVSNNFSSRYERYVSDIQSAATPTTLQQPNFTVADGTALNTLSGVSTYATAGVTTLVHTNKARISITSAGGIRYGRFALPVTDLDHRVYATTVLSDRNFWAGTIVLRHSGNEEAGTSTNYLCDFRAHDGTVVIGKHLVGVYSDLATFTLPTLTALVPYNLVAEVEGNNVRFWAGMGAWDGSWLVTAVDGTITTPPTEVQLYAYSAAADTAGVHYIDYSAVRVDTVENSGTAGFLQGPYTFLDGTSGAFYGPDAFSGSAGDSLAGGWELYQEGPPGAGYVSGAVLDGTGGVHMNTQGTGYFGRSRILRPDDIADGIETFTFKTPAVLQDTSFTILMRTDAATQDGYQVNVNMAGGISINKQSPTLGFIENGLINRPFTFQPSTTYTFLGQIQGTQIAGWVGTGTYDGNPLVSFSDSEIASGQWGIQLNVGVNTELADILVRAFEIASFTGGSGSVGAPFTPVVDTNSGTSSSVTVHDGVLDLFVHSGGAGNDRYARVSEANTNQNFRHHSFWKLGDTNIYSRSVLGRHNGSYEGGTSTAVICEARPLDGQIGFGKRVLVSGSSVYSEVQFTAFTWAANLLYEQVIEFDGAVARVWVGPAGTWNGNTWLVTISLTDAVLIAAGATIEDWQGDHGLTPTGVDHHLYIQSIAIESLPSMSAQTAFLDNVDDGGRVYLDNVLVPMYRSGVLTDSWIRQGPTSYSGPIVNVGVGIGPGGKHLETVDFFNAAFSASFHYRRAVTAAPPPPPPPPVNPPGGGGTKMLQGYFTYGSDPALAVAFGNAVGVDASAYHTSIFSWDTRPAWAAQAPAWLAGNPNRVLVSNWNWLTGGQGGGPGGNPGAGDWDNLQTDANAHSITDYLVGLGIANRVIFRIGYECNGPWFSWGSTQPGNLDGAGYKRLYNRVAPIFRAAGIRTTWGVVPGEPGLNGAQTGASADATIFYPGDANVDFIDFDIYDWSLYGAGPRIDLMINLPQGLGWLKSFATAHSKPFLIGEYNLANTNALDGAGDDPDWLTAFLQWNADNGCFATLLENVPEDINITLDPAITPRSWAAYVAWWKTYQAL